MTYEQFYYWMAGLDYALMGKRPTLEQWAAVQGALISVAKKNGHDVEAPTYNILLPSLNGSKANMEELEGRN